MKGVLYVVSTPIGNLGDLTYRAVEVLKEVDFIAAEDTRVTVKILNHINVKKPMVSYFEHNIAVSGEKIIARLLAGENCALCSDAGTPAISDPGQVLVRQAHDAGVKVVPVPGASAFVAALAAGGQATGRFVFEGFLSTNKTQRKQRLAALSGEERTVVFYEAPHKLNTTLGDLISAFGEERALTVARELTKLHEEIFMTTLGEAAAHYKETAPKGEFVLLLAGAPAGEKEPQFTLDDAVEIALALIAGGEKQSAACKAAAQQTGLSKNEIYRQILAQEESE